MTFKMKGFSYPGKSPLKQKTIDGKTYPKSYTKEDVEFLKEQREDVVRRSDFDEGSKEQKMFDRNQAKGKAKAVDKMFKDKKPMKQVKRPKTKSPAKQEGPIDEKQLKLQPSENPDTYVYEPGERVKKNKAWVRNERIGGLEDRASFVDETANAEGRSTTKQEKKDKAKLQHEADIMRNRKPAKKKK